MVNTGCVELRTVTTFTVRTELFDCQERKEIAKIQLLPVRFLKRFVKGERSFVLTSFLGISAYSFYFLRDFSAQVNQIGRASCRERV